MLTHEQADQRSLDLARAVVAVIDRDPTRAGLEHARSNCERWLRLGSSPAIAEWRKLLEHDWPHVRAALLDEGEYGRRLRQSSPFAGVLSPAERWAIFKRWSDDQRSASCDAP